MMRKLHHPNIIHFLGVVYENEHLSIITEYVDGGTLKGGRKSSCLPRIIKLVDNTTYNLYVRQFFPEKAFKELKYERFERLK